MIAFLRTERGRAVLPNLKMPMLTGLFLLSAIMPAAANNPPPVADHAWGGCSLPASLRTQLNNAIKATASTKFASVSVDFIVVHSVAADNDGQPLTTGGTTGVILCTFKGGTSAATPTQETTPIPDTAGVHPGSTNIDILTNQEQSVLQYKLNNGALAGTIEKRVCQTTDGNTDCYRVYKPSGG